MSELKCYYHPDSNAMTKCEDCGKPICLRCKKIHREKHHTGVGESSGYIERTLDLCGPCYYNKKEKIASSTAGSLLCSIIGIVFSLIFIGVAVFIFGGFDAMTNAISGNDVPDGMFDIMSILIIVLSFFFILGPVICILLLVYNMLTMGKRSEKNLIKLSREREQYMANTGIHEMEYSENYDRSPSKMRCGNCGETVSAYDEYCPGCGDKI